MLDAGVAFFCAHLFYRLASGDGVNLKLILFKGRRNEGTYQTIGGED